MASSTTDGFRFSFGDDDEETDSNKANNINNVAAWPAPTVPLSSFPWIAVDAATLGEWYRQYPAVENKAAGTCTGDTAPQYLELPLQRNINNRGGGAVVVCYQTAPELTELTMASSSSSSPVEARDIIPGKYYGGLKVWSCAPDLARYLAANSDEWRQRFCPTTTSSNSNNSATGGVEGSCVSAPPPPPPVVAEVGCGQAIPGLTALALGAQRVILQDYNAPVLDVCVKQNTAATVLLAQTIHEINCNKDRDDGAAPAMMQPAPEVKLVHGDWIDLAWDSQGESNGSGCDVILGADVTFDEEACDKLADLLARWLAPGRGVALIATKVFYFGTNGGSLEFSERAARRGLVVAEAARVDEDGGMRRVILRVTRPSE